MSKLLQEPLVHFILMGLGLFVLFEFVASDDDLYDNKVINVDRDALLTFVQYRSRAFEPQIAAARLDGMAAEELDALIDDYVREEALHREALSLGMDKNDYIIKRRMIQSIEFITNGFATAAIEVSDEDIQTYYEANRDDYYIAPFVTFTHVFFDAQGQGRDEARALAKDKLVELNALAVPFSDAPRHGDRFPYFVNYVEREPEFVASHFGVPMAESIFALEPGEATWHGPFESEYGIHIVLLVRNVEGRYPELSEVAASVRSDAEREAIKAQQDKAIQGIVDTYEVRRSFERQIVGSVQ